MYTILETFVGAGGAFLGFKNQGFESRYVNDINADCIKTLIYNNPQLKEDAYIENKDIMDINPDDILKHTGLKPMEADVLFGGIVCKGFSLAGERCPNDERNYFYHKQLELVKELMPKVSIIENVSGILNATVLSQDTPQEVKNQVDNLWKKLNEYKGKKSSLRKNGTITNEFELLGVNLRIERAELLKKIEKQGYMVSVLDDIQKIYKELGYKLKWKVLNSATFGAATKRERVILVAVRNDLIGEFNFPKPTHADDELRKKYKNDYNEQNTYLSAVTVNDVLSLIDYAKHDTDNIPMKHADKTVERFKYIKQGENIVKYIDELPEDLKISKFYSRGSTMRLDGNKPSPTLVPGHSNFPIHPTEHRSITVREAACITGFPMNYKFFGNHSKRCEHVGNAVPPKLAEAIAIEVKRLLDLNNNA